MNLDTLGPTFPSVTYGGLPQRIVPFGKRTMVHGMAAGVSTARLTKPMRLVEESYVEMQGEGDNSGESDNDDEMGDGDN
jgi:hypothetical protein